MKKILFRIIGVIAVAILVGNCVGCKEQSPEKGNTSNEIEVEVETIEVETIEVETIEVKENVVYWPD